MFRLDRIPWASIPIPIPWGRLPIYLHEWVIFVWAKYVGKYTTSPMDGMGIVWMYCSGAVNSPIFPKLSTTFAHSFSNVRDMCVKSLDLKISSLDLPPTWLRLFATVISYGTYSFLAHEGSSQFAPSSYAKNIPWFHWLVITTNLPVAGCLGKSSWTHERFWTSHVFLTLLASLLLLKATCSSALRQQNPARPSPKGKARIWSNETKIEL